MATFKNIPYTGALNKESVEKFVKAQSKGCYIFYTVCFSSVIVTKRDKLPSSKHAASDYPYGYYHDGKLCQWSEARIIAAQNAGQTKD